jgi:uncharacterized protein
MGGMSKFGNEKWSAKMLIEFSVANFLSFKERKTLSMEAAKIKDEPEHPPIHLERTELLRIAAIYGANSSGKSNLIKAMSTMRRLVLTSSERSSKGELNIKPFLLHTSLVGKPSYFEIVFFADGNKYRYGFEVDNTAVRSEWLFVTKKQTEKPLFLRENDGIQVYPHFKEGKNLEERTRDNALFLSVVDQFNGPVSKAIVQWFYRLITISGLKHEHYKSITYKALIHESSKHAIERFLSKMDLGFDEIMVVEKKFDRGELPEELPEDLIDELENDFKDTLSFGVKTIHRKYGQPEDPVMEEEFELRSQESSGTNKVFNLSGPIFDVLEHGGVLVVDELDSSLHPLMTLELIRLFQGNENHLGRTAQFIFATHDTNLLSYGGFRRDQIYFVEKDQWGGSDVYSLVEYREDGKPIRPDRSFEKDYIQGRYGAIPFIGNVSNLFQHGEETQA